MVWLLIGLGGAVVAGLVGLGMYYSYDAVIRRALRSHHAVRISRFREGTVGKIKGVLRYPADAIAAPLSGRACAYYSVRVGRECRRPDCHQFDEVASELTGQDFLVEDDTGIALVIVENAEALIHLDKEQILEVTASAKDRLAIFLLKHGESTDGRFRYEEGVLEQGETVVVCGHGTWEPDPDPSTAKLYRELAVRLVIRATKDAPVYISDDPELIGTRPRLPPAPHEH